MRPLLAVVLVAILLVPSAAMALDLPVAGARGPVPTGAFHASDRLVLRLAPDAAGLALQARAMAPAARRLTRLGVASVDAAAGELGLGFEPEFRGARAPADGAAGPDLTQFYLVHLPAGLDLETALARLGGLPGVQSVEPVAVLPVCATPNDSLWSESWWYAQSSGHDVRATEAWDVTTGDTTIVVGILDTGLVPYHPDIGGREAGLAGQVWTNWAEQAGVAGVDDDGNGYVDDVHGWDFVENATVLSAVLPFEDYANEDPDPNDYAGHGTMVAGLVGALTDNTIGVAGMAWQVRLMPLRIGWAESGAPLGLVDMTYVARALHYATVTGARVVNCSFQSRDQSDLAAALDAAIRAGVVVVSAAGNNYGECSIGEREDVIAVAATDAGDDIPSFSTLGDWVDLAAPGVSITSTAIARATLPNDSLGYRQSTYGAKSGTSFSAPLVAGAAALLEARQRALGRRPLPPRAVQLRLRETADDIAAFTSETGYGTGRLDAYRALTDRTTSLAWSGGAATVGPEVPIPLTGPTHRLACVTSDGHLLIRDWVLGDTVALATLPGVPAGQLAAADLGGGYGVGLFVGTKNGYIAGYDTSGTALVGFPKRAGAPALAGGPALGDVDGDGVLEVVCGAANGYVRAWRADGTAMDGFPVETDGWAISAPVALSDLDGLPGVEIVAVTVAGDVYAIGGDGSVLPGWPVALNSWSTAPVVARIGTEPVVLLAAADELIGLRGDGSERLRWSLPGTTGTDPALADFDGDGADEVVLPVTSPTRLVVLDSTGRAPAGLGWPATMAAVPQGVPVIGNLTGDGRPGVVMLELGGLVGYTDSARVITGFPALGGAGAAPTLADLLGDGATRIAAGSGSDTLLYVYDTGAGTAVAAPQPWPTPRGNFARTGSHLYLSDDALRPARVDDLAAACLAEGSPRLTWDAPGDDGMIGRASAYELRFTTAAAETASATAGTVASGLPEPDTAGTAQSVTLAPQASGVTCWYWLRSRDEAGNWSRVSNVCELRCSGEPEPVGFRLAVRRRPSRLPVVLDWQGVGAAGIRIHDVTGRIVRRLGLGAGTSGSATWDGRDEGGHIVPAGLYFARLTGGSFHAQTRIVLLP